MLRLRSGEIRIFRADSMEYTMFAANTARRALAGSGFVFVDSPYAADIVIARRDRNFRDKLGIDRQFIIWTHEPRYSLATTPSYVMEGIPRPVFAMTAHNGAIYQDCFHYGPADPAGFAFDALMASFRSKPRRAVMLATYKNGRPLFVAGRDVDLTGVRERLGRAFYRSGSCDIHGRDWPPDVVTKGESRGPGWAVAKEAILAHAKFNIALENTMIPFYISEKIWDAVRGGTLPLYHGSGNRVYDVFEEGSFVEVDGKSPEALVDEVMTMTDEEAEFRYERCLRAYEAALGHREQTRTRLIDRTIDFVTAAADGSVG